MIPVSSELILRIPEPVRRFLAEKREFRGGPIMSDFSFEDLLISYRTRTHLTQSQVAGKLGVGLRTYQGWEYGEKHKPLPQPMLQRIVNLFELSETEADQFYRSAAQIAPEFQNLPFPRNPFFTGRETYLEQLNNNLKENGAVAIAQPIGVSGLGGVGKTQIALEYAHRYYPKRFRTILWVNAASKATLEESYLTLARLLELSQQNEREANLIVQAVKSWLEGHTKWLLILDNADDMQLVRAFLPVRPRGHILLTTRSQIMGNIAAPMILEAMEPEEGLRFLLKRSGAISLETEIANLDSTILKAADQLVDLLGRHPLALDQAGAYIQEAETSFEAYIQLYDKQRRFLLEKRGALGDEHPETVVITFEVCFQHAYEVCPLSVEVLSLCAFLSPDAIPEEIFNHDDNLKLSLKFDEAVAALRKYSLIKRNVQNKLLSIHRLVQAVFHDRLEGEASRVLVERVIRAVNSAFPQVEYSTWLQCERLLPHALRVTQAIEQYDVISEEAGHLLYKTASYLYDRSRYVEAEPLYLRTLYTWERLAGPEHPDVAIALNALAVIYKDQSKYTEAESLYLRALHIWDQQKESEHPGVATSLNRLANLYLDQGRYTEAEPLYLRAIDILERLFGPEHLQVMRLLGNLAVLYKNQGRYNEAGSLYQRALRISEQQLESEHPELSYLVQGLANLYAMQDMYEEAEPLYQRALHIREQQFGPDHHLTGHPVFGLASLYCNQGR